MAALIDRAAGPRIALYSHDTMGFGHVRRNILLAQVLSQAPLNAEVLLISGIHEAGSFALPPGVDCITLPAYRKQADGSYRPRSLGDALDRLVSLRAGIIRAALRRFEPDMLIVDNVPRGALGELRSVLPLLAERGTRLVLGLRDILDEPEAVRRQWWRQRNYEAVRKHYDAVWVYGDSRLYDAAEEYGFGVGIGDKLQSVGYLDQSARVEGGTEATQPAACGGRPYALCVVGGGQDGLHLTETFARARLPAGHHGLILTGSMMPPAALERIRAIAGARPDMSVTPFATEPLALMRGARCVVAMGGYNTVTEILSLRKRALIVPRTLPRQEQWIRAQRLAALGLIDCLHPDALDEHALGKWLQRPHGPPPMARARLDFNGLARVPQLVRRLLDRSRMPAAATVFAASAGGVRHATR